MLYIHLVANERGDGREGEGGLLKLFVERCLPLSRSELSSAVMKFRSAVGRRGRSDYRSFLRTKIKEKEKMAASAVCMCLQ